MNKEEIKLSDKELQKCLDELQGTNFLNAFCVLDWILKTREENKELHNKIDKAIDFIDIYTNEINLEAFDCLKLMYKIKDLLKDSDADE